MNLKTSATTAVALATFISSATAGTLAQPAGKGVASKSEPQAAPSPYTVFGSTFFDELKAKKDAAGIPITLGAWHWFRFGDKGPGSNGYGIPGLRDTYFWTVDVDPKLKIDSATVSEIGLHAQIRFRENGLFRSFIDDQIWPWESYVYAKTTWGTFKAGQIWKRFGLDWDGVFYGNTAYFDGQKLDPDLGVSWEHSFAKSSGFKIDTFAQFYVQEDGINGSLAGGDAESSDSLEEKNTGVVRIVPTWTFDDQSSLALGLSGSLGSIDSSDKEIGDDTYSAFAVDLTYTHGNFKAFGEFSQSHGVVNPTRYVSGGPSDKITNYLVGASYKTGPITWRANYSEGHDSNPGGKQSFFLPGVTIALTPNVDLYAEYVNWVVDPGNGPESEYENGYQLVLNWRF